MTTKPTKPEENDSATGEVTVPKKRAARTTKKPTATKKPRTPAQQAADARRRKAPVRKRRNTSAKPVEEPLITVTDEHGELKEPSVLWEDMKSGWNKFKGRMWKAVSDPAKEAGKEAVIETATRVLKSVDQAADGMENKKSEDTDDDSNVAGRS